MNMTNKLDHIRRNILDRLAARWEYWADFHAEQVPGITVKQLTLWDRTLLRIDTLRDHRDEALIRTINWLQRNYHTLLQLLASVLCVMFACSTVVTLASLAYGNGDMFVLSLFVTLITGAIYSTTETTIINK
jgi:hypothetical protein